MIKDIITYPTPTGVEYAPDIRVFDEELYSFIDDLKETIVANSLEGLAATQVGSYYNLVIIKYEDDFLELINPRILSKKGEVHTIENSSYFPNVSANLTRYETISLVYEDKDAKQHSLKADGELSILLQRKIDYLFGANFLTKLKNKARDEFEIKLNSNGASCPTKPTKFSRDIFIKVANFFMWAMLLILISSFFIDNMYKTQLYLSFSVVGINIAYIFYSLYENKKYSICTNCYNMSIFGVVAIGFVRLTILMIASYFLMKP